MLRVELTQPRSMGLGRNSTRVMLQTGMNIVDEKVWEELNKTSFGGIIKDRVKQGILKVHKSKGTKLSKKIIESTYLVSDLKEMKSKTKSASMLSLIDKQLSLLTDFGDKEKEDLAI